MDKYHPETDVFLLTWREHRGTYSAKRGSECNLTAGDQMTKHQETVWGRTGFEVTVVFPESTRECDWVLKEEITTRAANCESVCAEV